MGLKHGEKFLKERYEIDDSFFVVYDHYTPNYYRANVTGKFYSMYDKLDFSSADQELVDAIKTAKDKLPKNKYEWPVTTSHNYGWFNPLVLLDRQDRRFYVPVREAQFIKHEIRLRQDRTLQKPKFLGIPFKL